MENINNITKFNLRAYAILIYNNSILALKENYAGQKLVKLPGGAIEFGETPIQTIKREFLEEINLEVQVKDIFYVQDFFLVSKFKQNEQLLTFYYKASAENIDNLRIIDSGIENLLWIPIKDLNPDLFTLPVDKKVIIKLINEN